MKGPLSLVPILNTPDEPVVSTSQKHLPIARVEKNIAVFKDGGAAMVMESTSLNFGLLSEGEQQAVVAAYAALINSLSFHVQILVRTQKKDITSYISYLDQAIPKARTEQLKELMVDYKGFISETIKKRNVLGKRFFLIIPFSAYELGLSSKSTISIKKKKGPIHYPFSYVLRKAEVSLNPKRDHLYRQAARLGLRLRQIDNEEIIALYYDVYNPPIETVRTKESAMPEEKEEEKANETVPEKK
jgi:hypothetical protein